MCGVLRPGGLLVVDNPPVPSGRNGAVHCIGVGGPGLYLLYLARGQGGVSGDARAGLMSRAASQRAGRSVWGVLSVTDRIRHVIPTAV